MSVAVGAAVVMGLLSLYGAKTQADAQKKQAEEQAKYKRWQADQLVSNAYKTEKMVLNKLVLQEQAIRTQMEFNSAKIQADGRAAIGGLIARTGGSGAVMDNMGSPYLAMVNSAIRINQADRMNMYQTRKQIESSRRDTKDQLEAMWANTYLNAESLRMGADTIDGAISSNYLSTMIGGVTSATSTGLSTWSGLNNMGLGSSPKPSSSSGSSYTSSRSNSTYNWNQNLIDNY